MNCDNLMTTSVREGLNLCHQEFKIFAAVDGKEGLRFHSKDIRGNGYITSRYFYTKPQ